LSKIRTVHGINRRMAKESSSAGRGSERVNSGGAKGPGGKVFPKRLFYHRGQRATTPGAKGGENGTELF